MTFNWAALLIVPCLFAAAAYIVGGFMLGFKASDVVEGRTGSTGLGIMAYMLVLLGGVFGLPISIFIGFVTA